MSDFSVEAGKLDDLAKQIDRTHEDAKAGAKYVEQYTDLSWGDEGLLMQLAFSHDNAYDVVHGGMDGLDSLGKDIADLILVVKEAYEQLDDEGRQAFDDQWATLQEAGLPEKEGSPQPSETVTGPPFENPEDPTKAMECPTDVEPPVKFTFDPTSDTISPSSWVRWGIQQLTGEDPFAKWLTWLSGDWLAYSQCTTVWECMEDASKSFRTNLHKAIVDAESIWTGRAADQFVAILRVLGYRMEYLADTCGDLAKAYPDAVQAAKDLHEGLSGIVGMIIDWLIAAGIAAAAGTALIETVVGAVAGYALAGYCVWQIVQLIDKATTIYGTAKTAVQAVIGVVSAIEASGIEDITLPDKP
jgi:hypothetical protein